MKISVKNMVSTRCIMAVKASLDNLHIPYEYVELGEIETRGIVTDDKLREFNQALMQLGLEVRENKKYLLVEKIKAAILDLVNNYDEQTKVTLSEYLSRRLNYNCTYLSNIFSDVTGISIEKYFISKKIEHVKELLVNKNLNLKEISYLTNYSSVAHLSYQFKKMTGFAPSEFRMMSKGEMVLQEATF